jgi:purine-cytosine permease-like protein
VSFCEAEKTIEEKERPALEGLFFFFSQSIVLFLVVACTVLPTNTHIQVADHFLNQNCTSASATQKHFLKHLLSTAWISSKLFDS